MLIEGTLQCCITINGCCDSMGYIYLYVWTVTCIEEHVQSELCFPTNQIINDVSWGRLDFGKLPKKDN